MTPSTDPYYIDFPGRITAIQKQMAAENIDVYLGSRLICAMQYACPEENIGVRYKNPIVLSADGCEKLSKFQLSIE